MRVEAEVRIAVESLATVQSEVITYPRRLLRVARELIDQQEPSIAVVVAHMACEIAVERCLTVKGLDAASREKLNGYNLAAKNKKVRHLYTSLTGDKIQSQAFWQDFKKSACRRNRIMHAGLIVGKSEADKSHRATRSLVAYLEK
jgi:hypothetical protein